MVKELLTTLIVDDQPFNVGHYAGKTGLCLHTKETARPSSLAFLLDSIQKKKLVEELTMGQSSQIPTGPTCIGLTNYRLTMTYGPWL